jgi:hypothetical protein
MRQDYIDQHGEHLEFLQAIGRTVRSLNKFLVQHRSSTIYLLKFNRALVMSAGSMPTLALPLAPLKISGVPFPSIFSVLLTLATVLLLSVRSAFSDPFSGLH